MDFTTFFIKIFPLYLLIGIGFLVGRRTKLRAPELAAINLQFIAPMIFFDAISRVPFAMENIFLPLICFALMGLVALAIFYGSRAVTSDEKTPYWLAATGSSSNTGYFGIPVFLLMFGEKDFGLYLLYTVGSALFFFSVVNFLFIRNEYDLRQSLKQMLRLPVLHAMVLGILAQLVGFQLPSIFDDFMLTIRHAYVVLGMMIIGLVLGHQSDRKSGLVFEWRLLLGMNVARYLLFPGMALAVVLLDRHVVDFLSPMAGNIILLVSLMPMAADATSFAARNNMHPERTAALVLANSILALFVIPLLLPYLLSL